MSIPEKLMSPMSAQSLQLRWGVEQRLEFIEFRLFWEGGINRSDIVGQFGVSVPQASHDLRHYQQIAPRNLIYDKSSKRYVSSVDFKPVLSVPKAADYLTQLGSREDEHAIGGYSWLSDPPPVDFMPLPYRSVSVNVLREVLSAVPARTSLEIDYQTMGESQRGPKRRWITPHAFAHDGTRWHVRAYCHIDDKFKDFLLSRILSIHDSGQAGAAPDDDHLWHDHLLVVFVPNPELPELQQRMVAIDYDMKENRLEMWVRKALLYYFARHFRLDLLDGTRTPYNSPIVVENSEEFYAALAEAST